MAWYWILLIVLGAIFLIVCLGVRANEKSDERRVRIISKWMVGDELTVIPRHYKDKLRDNNKKYAKLVKWSKTEALVDFGDDSVYALNYNLIDTNVSYEWRERYSSMDSFMKTIGATQLSKETDKNKKEGEPKQKSEMDIVIEGNYVTIDGTPLIGMPEIYLTIYQGIAMREKKFKLLELINEELKKHR